MNSLTKFLINLSDVLQALHMLTKKGVPWVWSEFQQELLDCVKNTRHNTPVLAYYDPHKNPILENYASKYRLLSALFQEGKPIAYASQSLTDTEKRYAQGCLT